MQSRIELSAAPGALRCELRSQPLGVGSAVPGFSWQSMDSRIAEVESAWQILVATERRALVPAAGAPTPDLWDSGVIAGSCRGLVVPYGGVPLVSRQRFWWTVRTFDSDGLSSGYAEPACVELALLANADWQGEWLGVPWQGSATDGGVAAALVRDFAVGALPSEARLYIAVLGRATVELNGRAVASGLGDRDASDPHRRHRYSTLDVTRHLLPGANRLGVLLGDGACCGNQLLPAARQAFAPAPQLLVQLEWRDTSGHLQRVVSDADWLLYRSPILSSDPVLGEALDLRRWNPNWSLPQVALQWECSAVERRAIDAVPLVADASEQVDRPPKPTTELLTLDTLEYLVPESRSAAPRPRLNGLLIDLGRVRQGRLRVDGRFPDGGRLIVHYAQTRQSLATALDSDRFTTGEGDGELEAVLAERSFRYARLAGDVEWRDVTAIRFSTSNLQAKTKATELLECDQPALAAALSRATALVENALAARPAFTVTTARGQELRPLSWIEPLVGSPTVLALFADPVGVRKWLEDARDALHAFGTLPPSLPAAPRSVAAAVEGRTDLFVHMLWVAYSGFGDVPALAASLPELELLVARWQAQSKERFWQDPSWRDERRLPAEYVGGARLGVALKLAAQLAEQVDAVRAASRFRRFAAELRAGFRDRYLTQAGQLLFRSADACLFALTAGLLEPSERALALDDLVRAVLPVVRTGAELPVLPELYSALFEQLFAHDQHDLAYQLLTSLCTNQLSERAVDRSAERLSTQGVLLTTDDSEALSWLPAGQLLEVCYGVLLGLQLPRPDLDVRPAFRDWVIEPQPPRPAFAAAGAGASPTRLKAQLATASGAVTFGWQLEGATMRCLSALPGDFHALLKLPNGQSLRQSAGDHEFVVDLQAEEDGIPVLMDAIRGAVVEATVTHS